MAGRHVFWLVNALMAGGVLVASGLPFSDGFEGYAVGTTFVAEKNGWQSPDAAVVVETVVVYDGAKAVVLPAETALVPAMLLCGSISM